MSNIIPSEQPWWCVSISKFSNGLPMCLPGLTFSCKFELRHDYKTQVNMKNTKREMYVMFPSQI